MSGGRQDRVARARAAFKRGEWEACVSDCEQVITEDASEPLAFEMAIASLVRLGRIGPAVERARQCLARHLGNRVALGVIDRYEDHVEPEPRASTPSEGLWQRGEVIQDRWEVFGSDEGGGMARIYFARDRAWQGMELAVKTLYIPQGISAEEVAFRRDFFLRETRTWLDLGSHPNIVSGFYTLEVQNSLRFFMEYVPGRSLEKLLRAQTRPMELPQVLDLAIQLALGMEYVHHRNTLHRDIKPSNCLIGEGEALKVTDFGLGKVMREHESRPAGSSYVPTALSRDRERAMELLAAGTPVYMAPEQWKGLEHSQGPADVYAFGVLLYEMLTGVPPFALDPEQWRRYRGRVPGGLDHLLRATDPAPEFIASVVRKFHEMAVALPMSELRSDVIEPLEMVVQRCLAKDPTQRWTFTHIRQRLLALHELMVGEYTRGIPDAVEPTEAGENNRAVSYHVMGSARAREIFDQWLSRHPHSLPVWINRQILAISQGEVEPTQVAGAALSTLRPIHRAAYEQDALARAFDAWLAPSHMVHPQPVLSVAVSPDGATYVTGSADHHVRLWDAATGRCRAVLRGHEQRVCSIAVSPDGRWIASGSYDECVRLWSIGAEGDAAEAEATLKGHGAWVSTVRFTPDGKRLLTAGRDGGVRVWDIDQRRQIAQFVSSRAGQCLVAFSDDGSRVMRAVVGASAQVIDLKTGKEFAALTLSEGATAAVFGRDGALWVGGPQGAVTRFDAHAVPGGQWRLDGLAITALATTPDGEWLIAGGDDGSIRVCDARDGSRERKVAEAAGRIEGLAAVSDGVRLLSASGDGTARVFGVTGTFKLPAMALGVRRPVSARELIERVRARDALLERLGRGDIGAMSALEELRATFPEMQRDPAIVGGVAVAGAKYGLRRGVRDAWTRSTIALGSDATAVGFFPDGRWIYSAGQEGVTLWDDAGRASQVLSPEVVSPARTAALTADGQKLLVATLDKALRVWDPTQAVLVRTLAGHARSVTAMALSPDGAWAATTDGDSARVWDIGRGELLLDLDLRPDGGSAAIAASACGRWLAIGTRRRGVRVVDARSGAPGMAYEGIEGTVTALAWSPCGQWLVAQSERATMVQWGARNPAERTVIAGSTRMGGLAFSPDGRMIVTAAADYDHGDAKLWRPGESEAVYVFEGHRRPVKAVAFGGGGDRVLTAGLDRTLRVWELDTAWAFAPEALDDAQRALRAEAPATLWSGLRPDSDADRWGAVLRDLARCATASGLPPDWSDRHARFVAEVSPRDEPPPPEDRAEAPSGEASASHGHGETATLLASARRPHAALEVRVTPTQPVDEDAIKVLIKKMMLGVAVPQEAPGLRVGVRSVRRLARIEGGAERVTAAVWSPDGERFASGRRGGRVEVRASASGELLFDLRLFPEAVKSVTWSPDGRWLVVTGASREAVPVIDTMSGRVKHTLRTGEGEATVAAWGPRQEFVAVGTRGSKAQLWDAATGVLVRSLELHTDIVVAVAWSLDGRLVATGSHDQTVKVWDGVTGALVQTLRGAEASATALSFSPDGRYVLGGFRGAQTWCWEVSTGERACVLEDGPRSVGALLWTPNARIVMTCADRSLRFWDVTAARLAREEANDGRVAVLAPHPSDARILVGGDHLDVLSVEYEAVPFAGVYPVENSGAIDGARLASLWPRAAQEGGMHAWLDVWRDLSGGVASAAQEGLREVVVRRLRERLGDVGLTPPTEPELWWRHPFVQIAGVDPALLRELCEEFSHKIYRAWSHLWERG